MSSTVLMRPSRCLPLERMRVRASSRFLGQRLRRSLPASARRSRGWRQAASSAHGSCWRRTATCAGLRSRARATLLRDLLEQPGVLDGDHGLVGKSSDKFDLFCGERARCSTGKEERPNQLHPPAALELPGTSETRARRIAYRAWVRSARSSIRRPGQFACSAMTFAMTDALRRMKGCVAQCALSSSVIAVGGPEVRISSPCGAVNPTLSASQSRAAVLSDRVQHGL